MSSADPSIKRLKWVDRHPRVTGALLLVALHLLLGPFTGAFFNLKDGVLLLGVTQVVYLLPALIVLMAFDRAPIAKGMVLAALATFIANVVGCAILFSELTSGL